MQKPELQTLQFYDFLECMRFLEHKTGRNFRDYAGRHKDPSKPTQDFWITVTEKVCHTGVRNGDYCDLNALGLLEEQEVWEPWERELAALFASEFDVTREFLFAW